MSFEISTKRISLEQLIDVVQTGNQVQLSSDVITNIQSCRAYLDRKMTDSDDTIYGVNTGFGSLCNVSVSAENIDALQLNLVRSHACGAGRKIDPKITKIILLLKIINLSKGYSGASMPLMDMLLNMYNQDILPVIYEFGSLGASGDLAPLAHLALVCIGEGEVIYQGQEMATQDVFEQLNIIPVQLQAKEGLALLNGTQFSTAFAIYSCYHGMRLIDQLNKITAFTTLAFKGNASAFDHKVHDIRNQEGQIACAADIRKMLLGNTYLNDDYVAIQDPYSIRCVPQVHGASLDTFRHAQNILERELNAVTDNPNIFHQEDEVISAGNFHAQPIALILDFMNIALSELGNISERRVFQLLSGQKGLPSFLVAKPGLNSGMMIAQYTAASIVNQTKTMCMPNSVDSIVSSNGQEDHVSMAANSATKSYRIVEHIYTLAGIELMCAMQATDFRYDVSWSDEISRIRSKYRKQVSSLEQDRRLDKDMRRSMVFVKNEL